MRRGSSQGTMYSRCIEQSMKGKKSAFCNNHPNNHMKCKSTVNAKSGNNFLWETGSVWSSVLSLCLFVSCQGENQQLLNSGNVISTLQTQLILTTPITRSPINQITIRCPNPWHCEVKVCPCSPTSVSYWISSPGNIRNASNEKLFIT